MSITVENIRIYSGIDADGSQYNSNLNSPPADLLTNTDYPRYLSGGIGENYWVGIEIAVQWALGTLEFSTNLLERTITITTGDIVDPTNGQSISNNTK